MTNERPLLLTLKTHPGYQALCELWFQEVTKIEAKRDLVASRKDENSWRFYAGLEKGFKTAMTLLDKRLLELEPEEGDVLEKPSETIEKLLSEARGETP